MSDQTGRRLRLAQVVTRMDIGGVPDHIMTLIRELHDEFDITVICGQIDDLHRHELDALGVAIITIPFRRLLSPIADLKTFIVASLGRWHLTKAQVPIAGHRLHYPKLS